MRLVCTSKSMPQVSLKRQLAREHLATTLLVEQLVGKLTFQNDVSHLLDPIIAHVRDVTYSQFRIPVPTFPVCGLQPSLLGECRWKVSLVDVYV